GAGAARTLAALAPQTALRAVLSNGELRTDNAVLTIDTPDGDEDAASLETLEAEALGLLLTAAVRAGLTAGDPDPVAEEVARVVAAADGDAERLAVRALLAGAVADALSPGETASDDGLADAWTGLGVVMRDGNEGAARLSARLASLLLTAGPDAVALPEDDARPALAGSDLFAAVTDALRDRRRGPTGAALRELREQLTAALAGIDRLERESVDCTAFPPAETEGIAWCRVTGQAESETLVRFRGVDARVLARFDGEGRVLDRWAAREGGAGSLITLPRGPGESHLLVTLPDGVEAGAGAMDYVSVRPLAAGAELVAEPGYLYQTRLTSEEEARLRLADDGLGYFQARTFDLGDGVDSVLTLQDGEGDYVDSDDDGGEGLASRLMVSMGAEAALTLVATNIGSAGEFTIEVAPLATGSLAPGGSQRLAVDRESPALFVLPIAAAGRYTLATEVLDAGVDTVLEARWPDGSETTNDDVDGELRSRMSQWVFAAGEEALVELR
ncbi:MAG: hypothetical protein MI723_10715, partial [Caulobacterales bacterium]|nr:hypothetical protein [Caulobacterales bacterium]